MPESREIKAFGLASILTDEAGQKAVSDSEHGTKITMIASTDAVDRDGEVIEVSAWSWNKETLPKLLWGHNYYEADAVIGRLTRVYRKDGKLLIDAELADKVPEATTARLVAAYLKAGFLDQGSVGFLPVAWTDPDGKDYTRDNPGAWWGSVPGRRYTKVELLEFSIVPVPSQRESLLIGARALGLADAMPREAPAASQSGVPDNATTLDSAPALMRVVSDGTAHNTKLLLPNGTDITREACISKIELTIDAESTPIETVIYCRTEVDVAVSEVALKRTPDLLQRLFTGQGQAGAIPSRAEMDGETSADDLFTRLRAGNVTRSAERAEDIHQET